MPDFGVFTIPLVGAMAVFFVALFTGDDIAIDNIHVPPTLEWNGYSSTVVTRILTDELREINQAAQTEAVGFRIDASYVDKSIGQFEDYFGLGGVVTGARNLVGAITYYVNAEVLDNRGEVVFVARVFSRVSEEPVTEIRIKGDPSNLGPMFHEAALQMLTGINPYVVSLYFYTQELTARDFDFPKTRAMLKAHIETPPFSNNYLAYDLIGRMHLRRFELDDKLDDAGREKQLGFAQQFLEAALVQKPDFLFANLNLAIVHAKRQEWQQADEYFARAVESDPNNLRVRQIWAEALAQQGRTRDAIYQYVAAVDIDPDDANLRVALADLYKQVNRADAAEVQLAKAYVIDPTRSTLHQHFHHQLVTPAGQMQ
jgi:tetratricopeptide (TPR) repeat protein